MSIPTNANEAMLQCAVLAARRDRDVGASAARLSVVDFETQVSTSIPSVVATEHAPAAFRVLRRACGVADAQLYKSLSATLQAGTLESRAGEGKGGAEFFDTVDGAFMVKTLRQDEVDALLSMLPDYVEYVCQQSHTYLPVYCNVISVRFGDLERRYMITPNLFHTSWTVDQKYDLKGSTLDRTLGPDIKHASKTRKDLDWLTERRLIRLPQPALQALRQQLQRDTAFLCAHNLMDYSLLLGVHLPAPQPKAWWRRGAWFRRRQQQVGRSCFVCCDGAIVIVGIIDILQVYNMKKKVESVVKSIRYETNTYSSVSPQVYASRFCTFMGASVFSDAAGVWVDASATG